MVFPNTNFVERAKGRTNITRGPYTIFKEEGW